MFFLFVGCQQNQQITLETLAVPKLYVSPYTPSPPKIDGEIDEVIWGNAPWSASFVDIEGVKIPKFRTEFKMLWDMEQLYILAQLEEPHVWGNLEQRDTVVFYNNDFEVFLDPDGDTHNYMELEINALNTVWDLFLKRPYRNKVRADSAWDIERIQTAVGISGSLNDPSDTDQGWVVEIALPWKSLTRGNTSGVLPVNRFWRINFSRVNWEHSISAKRYDRKKDTQGKYLPEYNWVWSPQGAINMHEPEHWGYVFFSDGQQAASEIKLPKDAPLLQWMYTHFSKKIALAKQKKDNSQTPTALWKGKAIRLEKQLLQDTVYWTTYNPFTKSTYQIRNDGKLRIQN